jgi:hypothetical protein
MDRDAEQRDAADEGRLVAYGNLFVGTVIKYQGEVVRPSQLIASVRPTCGEVSTRKPPRAWTRRAG